MRGQTYLVQSTGHFPGNDDLTGSLLRSNKPIALISGHQMANIDVSMASADHLIEMILPWELWGTKYFELPMTGRTICGDYIRVLSGEDGNQITYSSKVLYLNAGEWSEIPMDTEATYLVSANHKKFLTIQYSYSNGFNGDAVAADPFMTQMTPYESFEKRMLLLTPLPTKNGSLSNYLTVIAPSDSISTIKINGLALASYGVIGQRIFAGTVPQMSAWRVKLPSGSNSYLATANVKFGMYQYGLGTYEAYGWPSGMALNLPSPDTLPPTQDTLKNCGNYQVTLHDSRSTPKFSFTDSHIAEVSIITEPNDERWPTASFNYSFVLDPHFAAGDSTASFSLSLIDSSKDAFAAVYASDLAGNSAIYRYSYTAPKFSISPQPIPSFVPVVVGQDSCLAITIMNTQAAGKLALSNVHLTGSTAGGNFRLASGAAAILIRVNRPCSMFASPPMIQRISHATHWPSKRTVLCSELLFRVLA